MVQTDIKKTTFTFGILFFLILYINTILNGQTSVKQQLQSTQDSIQKYYQNQPVKSLAHAFIYEKIALQSDRRKSKAKAQNPIGM